MVSAGNAGRLHPGFGVGECVELAAQARLRASGASCRRKLSCCLKKIGGPGAADRFVDRVAGGDRGRPARAAAAGGASVARITETGDFAFLKDAGEGAVERGRVAFGGGEHGVVERQRGGVGDRDAGVVELDPAAVAGVKRQLFQLGSGHQPVVAEMLDEKIDRVAAGADAMRGEAVADHLGEVARRVGIAADRGACGDVVEGAPQRRPARAGRRPRRRPAYRPAASARKRAKSWAARVAGVAHPDHAAARPSG